MAKKIQFVYNEDGSIDWDNTCVPRIDITEEDITEIKPKDEE